MRIRLLTISTLALALAMPGPLSAQAQPVPAAAQTQVATPDYDAEALRIMKGVDATGFTGAVAIDGKIVYSGAHGLLEYGKPGKVTQKTLFPIASITKAFTTTALAMLVDEGKLSWDDPVRKYIPEFAMYDPWVSEHFTVKDALTHRSGLPLGAGDLTIWPDGNATPEDVIHALKYLRPTTGFRDGYAYDNLLYIVAGQILERASGQSWTDFITNRILKPVGMNDCAADKSLIRPGQSYVSGHERAAGDTHGTPIDPRMAFSKTWNSAGGIWCTADDMMKWGQFWLDDGVTADGKRLISEKQKNMLWRGVTPTGSGIIPASGGATNLQMYALGWQLSQLDGTPVVSHSGGAPGVTSNFIILPQKKIVIFASSNDYLSTPSAWTRQIAADLVEGSNAPDLIGKAIAAYDKENTEARAAVDKAISPPKDATKPSLPIDAYTGTYRDPWYGTVTISKRGKGLYIDMSRSQLLDGPLTPFNGDTFAAIWPNRTIKADAFVTFEVKDGKAVGIKMKAISDITDFSYDFHDLDLKRE
ncbi:serine hydrolase [Porphyrobacter algicida]|uniref:Serine hydrolase n=1 Tax=Qipengyuania algicida TaxID=1836209 RepID=A0A845ACP4_9SPHN|nr:serine hydrolase [Qipengyuania algicida]MXP27267.1 serine hydrolase [Qipengyuania algicida]